MSLFNFFFGNKGRDRARRDQWRPRVAVKNLISPINDTEPALPATAPAIEPSIVGVALGRVLTAANVADVMGPDGSSAHRSLASHVPVRGGKERRFAAVAMEPGISSRRSLRFVKNAAVRDGLALLAASA